MRIQGLAVRPGRPRPRAATPLTEFAFAANPGNLRAFACPPRGRKAALVVELHGCGQTAGGYDTGAGWSQLAAERGFAVLAMEQKASNNPGTCFDWFAPEDATRGEGEAASIAAAIHQMIDMHGLDALRVFVTGLSAGGAMTAAMLACYPELFAAGAIVAGLPYGAAVNVREALEAMRTAPLRTPRQWGDAVRGASGHAGPWPRVSVWHGAMDMTVNIGNAQASAAQWADLHGLALTDARQDSLDGAMRLRWGTALEVITLPTMGHGVPIDSRDLGAPAPFILDVGVSSTRRIAEFFGLMDAAAPRPKPKPSPARPAEPQSEDIRMPPQPPPLEARIESVIQRALKAAGLLRKK